MNFFVFLLGLAVSAVCSMVGLGGGAFITPALILLFSLPVKQAIGTSLFGIMIASISATIIHAKHKRVNYRIGLLLDTLDVPGAALGAYLTFFLPSHLLALFFGSIVLIMSALIMRKESDKSNCLNLTAKIVVVCIFGSFISGLVSGMVGVGGGIIDEAVMILALGMPIKVSAGTALFGMSLTTIGAVVPHHILGNVRIDFALPLGIGCAIGAIIGSSLTGRIHQEILKKILAAVMILIGIRMILLAF
ncbi:MAG: sulfite exporter TauE/SafE family protein [Candidatus Hadarchaeales archaeon]